MPKGVYKRTEEHNSNLSKTHIGQVAWNKGIPCSNETKEKLRKINLGKKQSPETIKKRVLKLIGKKRTEETKKKMSKSAMGNKRWLGKHHTEETKKKLSKIHKGKRIGEDSPSWIDGRSSHPKYNSYMARRRQLRKLNAEGSHTFEEWELLKKQYNYTCLCCKKSEPEIKLTEDHIIPLIKKGSDYIDNIQPLCILCNSKKNIKIIKYIYG